ncbi:MAG TPA: pyridoxamine 5'-phosphate oxidase family protein [Candidatus Saccharimonadales bacterium]|nr:pyridoxamine 5'-phosphate oxidase family protein [Candidatus Saccharimonadales bacterium]
MSPKDKAKLAIDSNIHMTVATVKAQGKPWVTPVFYVHDDKYNLYWVSYKESEHSKNIRNCPDVSIVIYGPVPPENNVDAVYIEATATQLENDNEVAFPISILSKHIQEAKYMINSHSDVLGDAAWRIYKATPQVITKRTETGEMINGQYIVTRETIDLLS